MQCREFITLYDVGRNADAALVDPYALDEMYDFIMASNVLNVQPTPQAIKSVLDNIEDVLKPNGFVLINLPSDPLKSAWEGFTYAESIRALTQRLLKQFGDVRVMDKGVFLLRKLVDNG